MYGFSGHSSPRSTGSNLCCISSSATARGRRKRLKGPGTPSPQKMVKCCQKKLSRYVKVCQGSVIVPEIYLCIQHIQLSATKDDKSIPWNTPKGQRCRRSQESPPALAPSNDFAAWILLLETSNNMASIWEDNGRQWKTLNFDVPKSRQSRLA